MRDESYLIVPGYLRNKLKLKNSELLITALILGHTQEGNAWFNGSIDYIADWVGIDRKNVICKLKKLVEAGIIEKYEKHVNAAVKKCFYRFNYDSLDEQNVTQSGLQNVTQSGLQNVTQSGLQNVTQSGLQNVTQSGLQNVTQSGLQNVTQSGLQNVTQSGLQNVTPYNIDTINIDTINNNGANEICTITHEKEIKERTTIFRNSEVYKSVKNENGKPDFSDFEKMFNGEEFKKIDLIYYFNAVCDWSDTKQGVKRTKRGWVATIRNFIRGDSERGKLHLKQDFKHEGKKINVVGAMDFLNDFENE
jgi:predicted transcriptional regulator